MLNHPDLSNICIYIADGALTSANLLAHLKSFASEYHLQVFSGPSVRKTKDFPRDVCAYPYVIYLAASSICIWQTAKGAPGPVSASFASGKSLHRLKFGGGKGQLIAKAVGLDKGIYPSVLDATAGLGRDSFVLASLGCHVQMIERSPVIALLLQSALEEVLMSQSDESLILQEICSRMSLRV